MYIYVYIYIQCVYIYTCPCTFVITLYSTSPSFATSQSPIEKIKFLFEFRNSDGGRSLKIPRLAILILGSGCSPTDNSSKILQP